MRKPSYLEQADLGFSVMVRVVVRVVVMVRVRVRVRESSRTGGCVQQTFQT